MLSMIHSIYIKWLFSILGYPRYTSDVHAQFNAIIQSMNKDIGVTVATSNSLFHQERQFSFFLALELYIYILLLPEGKSNFLFFIQLQKF